MVARRKPKAIARRELIADAADLDARGQPVPDDLPNQATIAYLERVRARVAKERGVDVQEVSRYAIAKRLGVTPNRISNYYVNKSSMDNKLAVIVARLLDAAPGGSPSCPGSIRAMSS